MIYKNFRLTIFLRVFSIVALSLAFAFILVLKPMLFVLSAIVILLIVMVISLIRYIEKSNKDLTHFLLSIRQGAFTESYTSGHRGKHHEQLSGALNDIVSEFSKLNREKELHYQYLQTLNENINVAILSFDAEGKLLMMNPAAKKLFNLSAFNALEHFKRIDIALYEAIKNLSPEQRTVVRVLMQEGQYQLSVQLKEIVLNGELVRIILLQNLNSELEAKEIEAWHQLMRVLTHEIMNSATPIVSLTAAVESILKNPNGSRKDFTALSEDNIEDIFSSLSTIGSRSKGLTKFVNTYKEYARPVSAKLEPADIVALVKRISNLLAPDLQIHNIKYSVNSPATSVEAKADVALIEQVLINLLKNAMEAVPHDGTGAITIDIKTKNDRVSISVTDNGMGIDPEVLPRIFVPFFTTKPKGSGIGLSLSRQIMKLHNGSIHISSPGTGSIFTIEWS
jgi:nitrogen fixation/metabolism regulation signal transduction histidine kinase